MTGARLNKEEWETIHGVIDVIVSMFRSGINDVSIKMSAEKYYGKPIPRQMVKYFQGHLQIMKKIIEGCESDMSINLVNEAYFRRGRIGPSTREQAKQYIPANSCKKAYGIHRQTEPNDVLSEADAMHNTKMGAAKLAKEMDRQNKKINNGMIDAGGVARMLSPEFEKPISSLRNIQAQAFREVAEKKKVTA